MECTLLTKNEACSIKQLQIFKKYGTNAAVTDFTLLLGIEVSNDHTSDTSYYLDPLFSDTRAADYWTKTIEEGKVVTISSYSFGYNSLTKGINKYIGIRPVIKYSDIKDDVQDKQISDKKVLEVEFGEYPQTVCDEKTRLELEKEYSENKLEKTGKKYSINKTSIFTEYYYNEKKYIRFIADREIIRTKLSNKNYIEYGKAYWIKVEPIIWMIDEKEDKAVSKKLLITGMPYDKENNIDFEKTYIYKYLNNYFIKEIKAEKKTKEKSKLEEFKQEIENMTLEELQELRIILENQMRKKVKIKSKGGIL